MKFNVTYIFVIILLSNVCIFPQQLKLGVKADFLTGNKYINYQLGPAVALDYSLSQVPVSVQGTVRFSLGEFSSENHFSTGQTFTVFSAGLAVNYYPVTWAIEPYLGAGLFYNSNSIQSSVTPSPDFSGNMYFPTALKNNISGELTLGIKFSANTPVNFITEITQTLNRPGYILKTLNNNNGIYSEIKKEEKLNLNSLFLKLGLLFNL